MNKNLFLRLLLVIAIFVVALYYSLVKPIKLGLDLKGGAYVVLEAVQDENSNVKIDNDAMNRLIEVLNRRVNGIGVAESTIQKAGDLVKKLAEITGGKGGGRADFAQAGGKNEEKLLDAFKEVRGIIESKLL